VPWGSRAALWQGQELHQKIKAKNIFFTRRK